MISMHLLLRPSVSCRSTVKSASWIAVKSFFFPVHMFCSSKVLKSTSSLFCRKKNFLVQNCCGCRQIYIASICDKEHSLEPSEKDLASRENFFHNLKVKDKATFMLAIETFSKNDILKRGHVEFIYAALKCMPEFGAERDAEVYKKIMDILPKGKMIPKNMIQAEFYHFPRQQDCALFLLNQMEENGLIPDDEMKELIINIFGRSSQVFKKLARMLYWGPKLKNISPYVLPDPLPSDAEKLAHLALKRMSVDLQAQITHYKADIWNYNLKDGPKALSRAQNQKRKAERTAQEQKDAKSLENIFQLAGSFKNIFHLLDQAEELDDSLDKTWIVSSQSPDQIKLIEEYPANEPLYVEGSFLIWLKRISISYFILRAAPKIYPEIEEDLDDVSDLPLHMFGFPKPKNELVIAPSTVHEQEDGVIMAMCATGTSSKDSLLSWIRFLQRTNHKLGEIPVVFTLRTPLTAVTTINVQPENFKYSEDESVHHGINKKSI